MTEFRSSHGSGLSQGSSWNYRHSKQARSEHFHHHKSNYAQGYSSHWWQDSLPISNPPSSPYCDLGKMTSIGPNRAIAPNGPNRATAPNVPWRWVGNHSNSHQRQQRHKHSQPPVELGKRKVSNSHRREKSPEGKRRAVDSKRPSDNIETLSDKISAATSTFINEIIGGNEPSTSHQITDPKVPSIAAGGTKINPSRSQGNSSTQSKALRPTSSSTKEPVCRDTQTRKQVLGSQDNCQNVRDSSKASYSDGSRAKSCSSSQSTQTSTTHTKPLPSMCRSPRGSLLKNSPIDIANIRKLTTAPRSRREEIELQQLLAEHASHSIKEKTRSLHRSQSLSEPSGLELGSLSLGFLSPADEQEIAEAIAQSDLIQNMPAADTVGTLFDNLSKSVVVVDDSDCSNDGTTLNSNRAIADAALTGMPHNSDAICHSRAISGDNTSGTSADTNANDDRSTVACPENAVCSAETSQCNDRSMPMPCVNAATEAQVDSGATRANTCSGSEQGPLATLLHISLEEEDVRRRLDNVQQEIKHIHLQVAMLKEQLDNRLQIQQLLLAEENKLRQTRLRFIQDAVATQNSSQPQSADTACSSSVAASSMLDTTVCSSSGLSNSFLTPTNDISGSHSNGDVDDTDNRIPVFNEETMEIQPITIEPDTNASDSDEVCESTTALPAVSNDSSTTATSPPLPQQQHSGVQMMYCGTLAGCSLISSNVLSTLAQNLITGLQVQGPAIAVCTGSTDTCQNDVATQRPFALSDTSSACQGTPDVEPDVGNEHSVVPQSHVADVSSSSAASISPTRREDSFTVSTPDSSQVSSTKISSAIRCMIVQNDCVLYAGDDGCIYQQSLQPTSSDGTLDFSASDRRVYRRHSGRILCMMLTHVGSGTDRSPALLSVGDDKRLVVVGYPIQAPKQVLTSIDCYRSNSAVEANGSLFIGLRNGRIAIVTCRTAKRRKVDLTCGRGSLSHVCSLAGVGLGRLLCISTCDSNEIQVRDTKNGKPVGKPLTGLSSPAVFMLGIGHHLVSSSGDSVVYVHNVQTASMEKSFRFNEKVVAVSSMPRGKDRLAVIADASGTIAWIEVKTGQQHTMYSQFDEITCVGCGFDAVYVGCSDGRLHRIECDFKSTIHCQFQHCKFVSWRPRDLKRHLWDDHVNQLRASSQGSKVTVCKWQACMEVISTDVKLIRKHLQQHVLAEKAKLVNTAQ